MWRALWLAAALTALGCGDDTTTAPVSTDFAQLVLDLAQPGQACGSAVCTGSCTVCVQLAGGLCAIPCSTSMPSTCASGICNAAAPDGGVGGSDGVTFSGDCGGYDGFCG